MIAGAVTTWLGILVIEKGSSNKVCRAGDCPLVTPVEFLGAMIACLGIPAFIAGGITLLAGIEMGRYKYYQKHREELLNRTKNMTSKSQAFLANPQSFFVGFKFQF